MPEFQNTLFIEHLQATASENIKSFSYVAQGLRWCLKACVDQSQDKKVFTLNLNYLKIFKNSDICRKA